MKTEKDDCQHVWIKERFSGFDTGDEVCTKCGTARWRGDAKNDSRTADSAGPERTSKD